MTSQNLLDIGLVILLLMLMYHCSTLGKRIDILNKRINNIIKANGLNSKEWT